jgi:hypothetical protein
MYDVVSQLNDVGSVQGVVEIPPPLNTDESILFPEISTASNSPLVFLR